MKITVTRALAELKILGTRIENAIANGIYVAAVRGSRNVPLLQTKSAEEVSADIMASYQSVESLIKRRDAIKRAVIVSNAETQVTIGGQTMSVAEAIERKSSITYLQQFVAAVSRQCIAVSNQIQAQNLKVEQDIEKRVMAAYGNDKGKVTAEQHSLIADAVKGESEAKMLDPAKIENKIVSLRKQYEDFTTEVDFVLSESNARTEIEVA